MAAAKDTGRSSTEMAGLVQLNLTLAASVDLERVAPTFGSPEAPWLGERAPDGPHGIRRFSCDLELRVSPERRELFRKAAIVGLGEPRHDDATWIVPIEWFAATFAPLFPVFVGELRLQTDRVGLRGSYVPPGARSAMPSTELSWASPPAAPDGGSYARSRPFLADPIAWTSSRVR